MERQNSLKSVLDDTDILSAVIEAATNIQGHTEYIIRVRRGPLSESSWIIKRRYNEFVSLHGILQESDVDLQLPPKKIFGNMNREFISIRQQGLQNYLKNILSHPLLASSLAVKRFLDPENYSQNIQEKTLQHVFMTFRSEPTWNMIEAIPEIGWRIRKQYFLTRRYSEPNQDYLMSWVDYGPDVCLHDKELSSLLKVLTNLNHPLIFIPQMTYNDKSGGVTIYKYVTDGSLRDLIYKAKPRTTYLKKYRFSKTHNSLSINEIKVYGKQILEALKYLHKKEFPYGHLHSGNVLLENGTCHLTGLENIFFGLPSNYRSFVTQMRKVNTLEDIDVYAFGHVLYEMVFGESLNVPTCDSFPSTCPPEIKCVLESILSTEASKGGLPTVEHLLMHPLFENVTLPPQLGKAHFKVTSQLREPIREVRTRAELRLLRDQKMYRQARRLLKAHSILLEEIPGGPRKNNTLVKKVKEESQDTRSASPAGSTENGSSSAPTPPPLPCNGTDVGQKSLGKSATPAPGKSDSLYNSAHSSGYGGSETPSPIDVSDRSNLLGAIQNFSITSLRKTVINDRSKPAI